MDVNSFHVGIAIIFTCLCARISSLHCCAGHNRTSSLLGVEIRACGSAEAGSGLHVHLACPSKYLLVDIEIHVGRSRDKCVGQTADLIAAVNFCYWKQSCIVSFPRKQMITCKPTIQQSTEENCPCFLAMPDMILVTRAKCAESKYVKDLKCKKRPNGRKKKRRNITKGKLKRRNVEEREAKHRPSAKRALKHKHIMKRSVKRKRNGKRVKVGIIRSHQEYPWFYKTLNETNVCSFNINHKKKDIVVLETKVNNICTFDGLKIVSQYGSKENEKYDIFDNNLTVINSTDSGKVTVAFTRNTEFGCGGFIICYKVTDSIGRQDVCEELMEKDAIMTITSGSLSGSSQPKDYTEQCADNGTDTCCGDT
ncbi:uncharacterized protein LOC127853856 [Dreissena polymorpha]|uniref:Uncharacterized protein n=1 Tax=Dreissena polymorpha TaxID=45954 RepID=A0A9D4CT28_DREPO|nr:uncharacterized protein LOC127853856 [Dreissena polymorpha]KAH3729710.1 hypothetical protein DPMN_055688 [Dreissena polymorpha]